MIAEYLDIVDYEAVIFALANNGQTLPERTKPHDEEPIEFYVHPDAF